MNDRASYLRIGCFFIAKNYGRRPKSGRRKAGKAIMSETTTNVSPETPQTTAQPVTPPQAAPAQAATVDMDAIISQASAKAQEAAEKKTEAVFKSMLQQSGLDVETINEITRERKEKQQTPEQAMQELQGKLAAETARSEALQQQMVAVGKGVPADKTGDYIALANARMTDGVTFEQALEKALEAFPVEKPKNEAILPPSGPVDTPTKEAGYRQRLDEARKNKNQIAAITIKQEAAREGIILN